jgi:tripartite-type tricarboxylate transporter receptor subunit TctC
MKRHMFLVAALACGMLPSFSQAAGYPDKPIRLIVPFPPGGTADIVARLVSDKMSAALGVAVVVDNRAGGAGGSVGTVEIMRAKPDGYTLGMATVGTLGTAPAVARHPAYDPGKSFSFISNLGQSPMLLAVGPAAAAADLAGLLAQVRKQPADSTSFATGGSGGVAHLMGARFQLATGTHLTHVPYRGASPAINDVAGGQVPILFDALTSSTPFIASGRLRALAVSGDHRTASLPQVPTFKELGLPQVSTQAWYGLIGPAGLPDDVSAKLSAAVAAALADAQVRERFRKLDTDIVGSTPAVFQKQVVDELARWRQLAASQNIVLD